MIRTLLLYKIEWTDRHPCLMLACAMLVMVAGEIVMQVMG